jgi:hypothetical protein
MWHPGGRSARVGAIPMRRLLPATLMCALGLASAPTAANAARPDLVQAVVSNPPTRVPAGASVTVRDVVANRGRATAGRSRTGYYLSLDRRRDPSDLRLVGRRFVPSLGPGVRTGGSRRVRVPVTAPLASFRLIACADDRNRVRERRATNNCRASRGRMEVTLPPACPARLTRLGVSYASGPSRRGVASPVTVRLPLNGISYFRPGSAEPDEALFADCSLVLALHAMAVTLKRRAITAVVHLGVYEYRCIEGIDPCMLSQHAHATAIDLHEFRSADGQAYSVETDWIINPDPGTTCSAPTLGAKDALLHDLVCEWAATKLFNIILTPNYNEEHRNHFHLDLTPGAHHID